MVSSWSRGRLHVKVIVISELAFRSRRTMHATPAITPFAILIHFVFLEQV